MKKGKKKISLNIPLDYLDIIDHYVAKNPNLNRTQLMIESTLQNIENLEDAAYISVKEKKGEIMWHVAEISNLANQIKNSEEIKKPLQEEVLNLWRSLN